MAVLSRASKSRKIRVNFNLIPDEYQSKFRLKRIHILVFLVGIGLIFNLFLYQAKTDVSGRTVLLNRQLKTTQNEVKKLSDSKAQAVDLKNSIEKTKNLVAQKQEDFSVFRNQKLTWTVIINAITESPGVTLESFSQRGNAIMLKGSTQTIGFIQEYVNNLNSTGLFSDISLFTELKSGTDIVFIINIKVKISANKKPG